MSVKNRLSFAQSEKARDALSKEQEKQIKSMFADLSKSISKEIKSLSSKTNTSSVLRTMYLQQMQKEIARELNTIFNKVEETIRGNMEKAADEVLEANIAFAEGLGLSVKGAFLNIPTEIVNRVASGKLYDNNWTLSRALWSSKKKINSDVQSVIAKGIAGNKSAYDIAKDLEKYVNPKARKDWEWSKVYPKTNKIVDYNAQRLARTMVSHAYQQALVETTKNNPFVTGLEWRSANIHGRTCSLCASRDGQIYEKDKLPLDHPNGLCSFYAVTMSAEDINSKLADWVNGDADASLDRYAKTLGYKG